MPDGPDEARGLTNWQGVVVIRPGQLLYAGAIGANRQHCHRSVQVLAGLSTPLLLHDRRGDQLSCDAAVIPARAPHAIVRGAARGLMIHLDSEWFADPRCMKNAETGVRGWVELARVIGVDSIAASVEDWPGSGFAAMDSIIAANCLPTIGAHIRHPAVAEVVRRVPEHLDDHLSFEKLARDVGLSGSRLAHVIRSELGLPFRAYVLDQRMQRALELIATGNSLTDAASGAGFSDSSHFNRVCWDMYGFAPSTFVRPNQWFANAVPKTAGSHKRKPAVRSDDDRRKGYAPKEN